MIGAARMIAAPSICPDCISLVSGCFSCVMSGAFQLKVGAGCSAADGTAQAQAVTAEREARRAARTQTGDHRATPPVSGVTRVIAAAASSKLPDANAIV